MASCVCPTAPPIPANTDYTLAQYVGMYTQPVAAGTFSVPYTLSYSGKSLSGTVSVIIKPASVSTNIKLSSRASYWFSDPINGSTGSRRSFHAAQRAFTDDALQAG